MGRMKYFIFIGLFFTSVPSFSQYQSCNRLGEVKVDRFFVTAHTQKRALLMCRNIDGRLRFGAIPSGQLFTFLDAHKDDFEFRSRASDIFEQSFESGLEFVRSQTGGNIILSESRQQDVAHLNYLAEKYNTWSGQSSSANTSTSTSSSENENLLQSSAKGNKSIIQQLKSGVNCEQIESAPSVVKVRFEDNGSEQNIIPVGIEPLACARIGLCCVII